jgi:hypothetical protein
MDKGREAIEKVLIELCEKTINKTEQGIHLPYFYDLFIPSYLERIKEIFLTNPYRKAVSELLDAVDEAFEVELGDHISMRLDHWEAIQQAAQKVRLDAIESDANREMDLPDGFDWGAK